MHELSILLYIQFKSMKKDIWIIIPKKKNISQKDKKIASIIK